MLDEKLMLEEKVWAVVGANINPDKYGNKIYKMLKEKGYKVYPVNPKYETVEGDTCYKSLSSLPEKPGVINMVIPPKLGFAVVEEAVKLGLNNMWFQPGTYNEELVDLARQKGIKSVLSCVLAVLRG